MHYQEFLEQLKPINNDTIDKEPFDSYKLRVKPLLPNWPDDPLEHWLYRHYSYMIGPYGWLGFDTLHFSHGIWSSMRVYNEVGSDGLNSIDGMGIQVYSNADSERTWLQNYMLREGTWPTPIIVLRNTTGMVSPRGEIYGTPFHLLEGHLRLGYFRNIFRRDRQSLKDLHEIWTVDVDVRRLEDWRPPAQEQ